MNKKTETEVLDSMLDELRRAKEFADYSISAGAPPAPGQVAALTHARLEEQNVEPSSYDAAGRKLYDGEAWEIANAQVAADISVTRKRITQAAVAGQAVCADRLADLLDELDSLDDAST